MADAWVDFKTVKAAVTMRMALDRYGVNWLQKSGKEFRGRCPIHKGEGSAFSFSPEKNAFNCFSCGKKGNVLDFVAAMEQCTARDAALKLAEWFDLAAGNRQIASSVATSETTAAEESPKENKPLGFELQGIDPAHPYLAARGITVDMAKAFGLGFFPGRGFMSGRVVIPIHNERGELVAYAGRSIDETEPKYKLPVGFHKSLVLFNWHRAIDRDGTRAAAVVLVEGFFGCIKVHAAGFSCVALMGNSLSAEQENLLCSRFTGAVLLLDGDEAGRKGTDDCLLRLGRRMWVKAATVPEGKQPDMLTTEELRALVEA